MSNALYAVREFIPYESMDIIALFTTMDKAKNFITRNMDNHYTLSIDRVMVDSDSLTEAV